MAKNDFKGTLKEGLDLLDKYEIKLKEINDIVEKVVTNIAKSNKNSFDVKTPQAVNQRIKERSQLTQQLTAFTKERVAAEKALIKQTNKNLLAEQGITDAIQKQRFETNERNRLAKESAILSSTLSTEYKKQSTILIQLRRTYKDVALTQGASSKEALKLASRIKVLDARLKKVDASAGQFQRSVGNYPLAMNRAAKAARGLASSMGLLGGAFLVVQVLRDAFSTVREFDKQLIAVQKTTNLTTPEIKLFKEEVISLGIATKGVSIQGLLKSSEIAGQLGIKGRDNILKFSKTIEQLKLTSDIAGEDSARSFAKFIEVSTDTVENADRLGSVITELGNNFATTESQILSNTLEIQRGLTVYDVAAQTVLGFGAATSALGIQAEAARSAYLKTFSVLNDGVATGKNLEKILKLTGQTAEEFKDEFGKDAAAVFQKFIKGLNGAKDSGENLTILLKELGLGGLRVAPVIGTLATKYEVLADAVDKANDEYIDNNALSEEAGRSAESLDSLIGDLGDSYDGFILSIENGDGVISKSFKLILGFLTDVLDGMRLLNLGAQGREGELLANLTSSQQIKELERLNDRVKTFGTTLEEEAKRSKEDSEGRIKRIKDEIAANDLLIAQKEKEFTESPKARLKTDIKELNEDQKTLNRTLAEQNGVLVAANSIVSDNTNKKKENTNATNASNEAKNRTVGLIRDELKTQKELLQSATNREEAKLIQEKVKALQDELVAILGNNKARENTIKALDGSIAFYKEIIKELSEEREKLSLNSAAYDNYTEKIEAAQIAIKGLKGELISIKSEGSTEGFGTEITSSLNNDDITDRVNAVLDSNDIINESNRDTFEKQVEFAAEAFSEINNLTNAVFDNKIQRLDDEQNRLNDHYALLLDNENLTEEQRSALEAERFRKEREIEKKKRAEQRKQAIFNKAFNAAEIIANTAVAVSKVLGQTGIFGIPASIPIIALGAVQLATVLAQPIPQYKDGRKDGKAEFAIVGDGGKHELIKKDDGSMRLTPSKSTLTYLDKGDEVIPDAKKYLDSVGNEEITKDLYKYSALASFANQGVIMSDYLMKVDKGLEKQTKALVKAYERSRPRINLHNHNNIDLEYLVRKQDTL